MSVVLLSDDEWEIFKRHKDFRDECCLKIGVLEYESQTLRARYLQQIRQSLSEEEEAAREIASRYNIHESKRWTIVSGRIEVDD